MDELHAITTTLRDLPGDARCVLATLVDVSGSSYRSVGARTLVLPNGDTVGLISGGCLEGDLLERAQQVLADGRPRVIRYDSTAPEDALLGLGLGCNGIVDVLLERVTAADAAAGANTYLSRIGAARDAGQRTALVTVFASANEPEVGGRVLLPLDQGSGRGTPAVFGTLPAPVVAAANRALEPLAAEHGAGARATALTAADATVEALLEIIAPPLPLTVCGAGPDAQPLVALAAQLGWATVVFDHRAGFARADRFASARAVLTGDREQFSTIVGPRPGEVVVLMTHSYPTDLEYLQQLAARDPRYIGVLGPRRRLDRLLDELGARAPRQELLYGPAGLDLGAESPDEIALSIVAEIRAVLSGRGAGSLRERAIPIHQRAASDAAGAAS